MASQSNQAGAQIPPQPQPADYSLPGVMRYLQNEWQRNERDRIHWDLERAEMKTRIAKLEGEKRGLQLLVESHAKKIAILESSIRNRSKEQVDAYDPYTESKALLDKELSMIQSAEVDLTPIIESRQYLDKCIQEIEYLLQSSNINSTSEGLNNDQPIDDSNSNNNPSNTNNSNITSPNNQFPTESQPPQDSHSENTNGSSKPKSASKSKTLGPWKPSKKLTGHLDLVRAVVFCSAEKLATGSDDGTIRVWNIGDKSSTITAAAQTHRGHEGNVTCLAYDSITNTLYSGGEDQKIRLWRNSQVTEIASVAGHQDTIWALALDEGSRRLASVSKTGSACIWDISSDISVSPLSVIRYNSSSDNDSNDGAEDSNGSNNDDKSFAFPTALCVAFANAGSHILVGYDNSKMIMYNVSTGKKVRAFVPGADSKSRKRARKRASGGASLSQKGEEDKTDDLDENGSTSNEDKTTGIEHGGVYGIAHSDVTGQAVAVYWDGTARTFSLASGDELGTWAVHSGNGCSVAMSPSGRELLTGGSEGTLKFWTLGGTSTRAEWTLSQQIERAHDDKAREGVLQVAWYAGKEGSEFTDRLCASAGGDALVKVYQRDYFTQ